MAGKGSRDPRRKARANLEGAVWSPLFQGQDPGFTRKPLELRHPFMDLRLVRFFLSLPVIPWCVEKGILRAYLRPRLPPGIWRRPKQGLQGDPVLLRLGELPPEEVRARFSMGPEEPVRAFMAPGVELGALVARNLEEGGDSGVLYGATRLHSLNTWLRRLSGAAV